MITSAQEYFASLYAIKDINIPTVALLLPSDEKIYEINLSDRTIMAPEYLSVQKDHFSETIYFKVDRYFDNADLTDTVCIIYFKHPKMEQTGHFYSVPFYDTYHFNKAEVAQEDKGKILIPWCISGDATKYAGPIEFSFNFFKLDEVNKNVIYSLNTLTATSKILYGIDITATQEETEEASTLQELLSRVSRIEQDFQIYWIEA